MLPFFSLHRHFDVERSEAAGRARRRRGVVDDGAVRKCLTDRELALELAGRGDRVRDGSLSPGTMNLPVPTFLKMM